MIEKKIGSEKAVVIIPEIYGINQTIKDWAEFFNQQGYDAYCVDLFQSKKCFSYSEEKVAYDYFIAQIGFDVHLEVGKIIMTLNQNYKNIIIFGSSVGAAIAWRLTDYVHCDGMIGYYGSRIRDYLDIEPKCPCLLLFAAEDKSFDVSKILPSLKQKKNIQVAVMPGQHGFADLYAGHFHAESGKKALDMVECFLEDINQ